MFIKSTNTLDQFGAKLAWKGDRGAWILKESKEILEDHMNFVSCGGCWEWHGGRISQC